MSATGTAEEVREAVREIYGRVAESAMAGCGCSVGGCCGNGSDLFAEKTPETR